VWKHDTDYNFYLDICPSMIWWGGDCIGWVKIILKKTVKYRLDR